MNVILDTSALVGIYDPTDQFHPRARAYFLTRGLRLFTTAVVVAETYTFIRSRFGYSLARQATRGLRQSQIATVTAWDADLDTATWAVIDEFSGVPLSYADASLVVLGRNLNIDTVFSFDDDLRQAGLRLVPSA